MIHPHVALIFADERTRKLEGSLRFGLGQAVFKPRGVTLASMLELARVRLHELVGKKRAVAGTITFQVELANRAQRAPSDTVGVVVDADRNSRTGSQYGWDYVIEVRGSSNSATILRFDGKAIGPVTAAETDRWSAYPVQSGGSS